MLRITVPAVPSKDLWDEANQRFLKSEAFEGAELLLEHSLVSLSKWEEITEKPFLGDGEKTLEETILYIKCMVIAPVSSPDVFEHLSPENIKEIDDYIGRKMTATTIRDIPGQKSGSSEFITAELIYYWMVALQIPFECQYWHLSKLTTLIRVTNIKNQPDKKPARPTKASLANRRSMAARARAQHGTRG
jgi:hypothetical protein